MLVITVLHALGIAIAIFPPATLMFALLVAEKGLSKRELDRRAKGACLWGLIVSVSVFLLAL